MILANPYIKIVYPLFDLALWYESKDEKDFQLLRKIIEEQFNVFERECAANNLPIEDSLAVKYALAVFIDEQLLIKDAKYFGEYDSFQLDYFGKHMGGEQFYVELKKQREKANINVLEIYYLCLQLGFLGKYALCDRSDLTTLNIELRSHLDGLRKGDSNKLSVSVYPKKNDYKKMNRKISIWKYAALFGVSIIVVYGIFYWVANKDAQQGLIALERYLNKPL